MTTLQTLKFFVTPEHDCSYLDDKLAQTLFVDPQVEVDFELYSQLSDLGFRRSGTHIYRPHCKDCNACVSVRIPLDDFRISRSQKRILSRNSDLSTETCTPKLTKEIYALYERYIGSRHADGDMYPPTEEQFNSFLVETNHQTQFHCFRYPQDKLLAVAVTDQLASGLSAVYTFFDPEQSKRSLGSLAVLWEIRLAKQLGLDYLYLGYWVDGCRKMDYKTRFAPLEKLHHNQWIKDA